MPTQDDCFVSVVAPLADDADILAAFVSEVTALLMSRYANYELVLVDDGSRDGTPALVRTLLAEFPCVRYFRLTQRHGIEIAISCGLDAVIGDVVVVMQPATDPPALIPELVRRVRAGSAVAFGVLADRHGQPWLLRAGAQAFYWLGIRVLGLPLTPNATLFRALSRQAVNAVALIRDRARYLRLLTASVGFESEAVPYHAVRRRVRQRTKSLGESVSLGLGLLISNSRHPLRLMTWLALGAAAVNVAYVGYVFAVYLLKPDVAQGWSTLSLQLSGSFAVLFVILGVLCEYVGQIQDQARERPLYVVQEDRTSTVMIANEARRNVADASYEVPNEVPDDAPYALDDSA